MTVGVYLYLSKTFTGRAILAVSQDRLALRLMGADPVRIKQLAFGLSIATAAVAGALLIIIGPVEPSINRQYIGRAFAIVVLGGMGSIGGTLVAALILGVAESFVATFSGPSWAPAVAFGILLLTLARAAARHLRALLMRGLRLLGRSSALILLAGVLVTKLSTNEFFFFAGYAILQATIMAVAWNILGGFTGYVNFGSAGFFAVGAYTSVALDKALESAADRAACWSPALIGGLIGLGTGYLTLRLRGVYFAIATLAHGDRVRDLRQQLGLRRRRQRRLHPDARDRRCSSTATSSSCSR